MGFQINYAGVDLPLDDPVILDWIDHNMPVRQEEIAIPTPTPVGYDKLDGLLDEALPIYPRLRIGDWFYPWGARRWSIFHAVATGTKVMALKNACSPAGNGNPVTAQPFIFRCDAFGSPGVEQANYTINDNLWMLPPRVLSYHMDPTLPGDPLFLVTLVDDRYFWQFKPSRQFLFPGAYTWDNLLTDLASALGITLAWPNPTPAVYGSPEPDSQLFSNYENLAVLLDAAASNVGCTLVREIGGANYTLLRNSDSGQATDSDVRLFNNRQLPGQGGLFPRIAGGSMLDNSAKPGPHGGNTISEVSQNGTNSAAELILPTSVSVTFPKFQLPNGAGTTVGNWLGSRPGTQWITDSYDDVWVETITLAQAGFSPAPNSITSSTKVFHDTAKAIYYTGMEAMPVNETTLNALAVQLAKDYYNSVYEGVDETYPGTLLWTPEGVHDILWSYRGATGQGMTRVIPRPWNQGVTEFQHSFGIFTEKGGDKGGHATEVKIVNGTPNADKTYDAVLVSLSSTDLSLTNGASVWFFDPNQPGLLNTNDIFMAKNAGFKWNGRKLYVRDDFDLTVDLDNAAMPKQRVFKLFFNHLDFVLNGGTRSQSVGTVGFTGTKMVCEGDGNIHTWTFQDGLFQGGT